MISLDRKPHNPNLEERFCHTPRMLHHTRSLVMWDVNTKLVEGPEPAVGRIRCVLDHIKDVYIFWRLSKPSHAIFPKNAIPQLSGDHVFFLKEKTKRVGVRLVSTSSRSISLQTWESHLQTTMQSWPCPCRLGYCLILGSLRNAGLYSMDYDGL